MKYQESCNKGNKARVCRRSGLERSGVGRILSMESSLRGIDSLLLFVSCNSSSPSPRRSESSFRDHKSKDAVLKRDVSLVLLWFTKTCELSKRRRGSRGSFANNSKMGNRRWPA